MNAMGPPNVRQCVQRTSRYVCWQCRQTRSITQNHLKRKEAGRQQWAEFAKEIRAKTRKSMLTILKERGLVHTIAGEENALDRLLIDKRTGAYVGVDPTAPSLHVGHLLPLMALFWMYLHGYHTVSLLGASTARIGDPTGRTTDRPVMTPTERKANLAAMHYQMKRIWMNVERVGAKHGYQYEVHWRRDVMNNAVWWGKLNFLEVLKVLGRGLRLGTMLSRDTVKTKMASGDGMSFAEFCYPIMQAWDWWHIYEEKGIQVQIGGSDQFGNIVAGIDAVKYIAKSHSDPNVRQQDGVQESTTPYGFTVPLLTTAAGAKFGKSAGNAIWLDQAMTSLFDLYGFFVRTADTDVEKYLKLFTFLPLPTIQSLMDKHKEDPSKRIPQHRLAYEFLDLIHGEQAAKSAEEQHRAVFQNSSMASLAESTDKSAKPNPLATNQNPRTRLLATYLNRNVNKYAPQPDANRVPAEHIVLPKSLVHDQSIARILWAAGLVSSRSEGHRLVENQGAYIGMRSSGAEQMSDDLSFVPAKLRDPSQSWNNVIRDQEKSGTMEKDGEEGLLILRVGKWKVRIVRIVSDKKYEELGIEGPQAWTELKSSAAARRQEVEFNGAGKKKDPSTRLEIEAISAEDNAKLRADLAVVPNPAEGQTASPGSSRLQKWEVLMQQQKQGRHDYQKRIEKNIKKFEENAKAEGQDTEQTVDMARKNLEEGLQEHRAYQYNRAPQRTAEARQSWKNMVGMVDDKHDPRRTRPTGNRSRSGAPTAQVMARRVQGTSVIRSYPGHSAVPPAEPSTGLSVLRIRGDLSPNSSSTTTTTSSSSSSSSSTPFSTEEYPKVGRLADLQAASHRKIREEGVERFGGRMKADKRKTPMPWTTRGKLYSRQPSSDSRTR